MSPERDQEAIQDWKLPGVQSGTLAIPGPRARSLPPRRDYPGLGPDPYSTTSAEPRHGEPTEEPSPGPGTRHERLKDEPGGTLLEYQGRGTSWCHGGDVKPTKEPSAEPEKDLAWRTTDRPAPTEDRPATQVLPYQDDRGNTCGHGGVAEGYGRAVPNGTRYHGTGLIPEEPGRSTLNPTEHEGSGSSQGIPQARIEARESHGADSNMEE